MNNVPFFDKKHYGWRRIMSLFSMFVVSAFLASAITGCHSSNNDDDVPPTVAAPGAPQNLTAEKTPDTVLSATLKWEIPLSGGDPASYEIYRTTTDPTVAVVLDDVNMVISIPAVADQATYEFVDNVGVAPGINWWVVSAKNAGGETPSEIAGPLQIAGPPNGGDEGFGNNFAAAMIFADDIGIGGEAITGTWTDVLASIDTATGLRPTLADLAHLATLPVTDPLPYLDPATTHTVGTETYYKQKTVSTWQGQWENGAGATQNVTAKWGDNLVSQSLTENSKVRIEMVLSKDITDSPLTSYWMLSLYGARDNEVYGTDGETYDNPTAFVFAANAHLKIQKLLGSGLPDGDPLYSQTLWEGSGGPNNFAAEVNVAGNFTYGFVWDLASEVLPGDITTGKTGTWRITFSLDPVAPAPVSTPDNTNIQSAVNGVLVNENEVYIDIQVQ
jgi:hypothetical protein